MSRNIERYICPFCDADENLAANENYNMTELKNHWTTFHNRPVEANWRIQCQNCIRKKNNGFLNIRINLLNPSSFLKHMKRQQCFKVVETSASTIEAEIVNDGETDQETINENNVIDQEISQENDEEIDQQIDQENDQQRDQEIEQLITEENINFNEDSKWTNQQKCVLKSILKNFFIFFKNDFNTFKNLEQFLVAQKEILIIYNDNAVVNIVEEFIQIIKTTGHSELQFCSPFLENEEIYEDIKNLKTGEIEKIKISENKKYIAVHVNFSNFLKSIIEENEEFIENETIKLQLFGDELNCSTFNDGFSEFLHVAVRVKKLFRDMSKLSSIYTLALLPTYGIKKFGGKPINGRYYEFFKNLFSRFNDEKTITINNKRITFKIVEILGDHCFLDIFFNVNAANNKFGSIPSCRICTIPPCEYRNFNTVQKIEESDEVYRKNVTRNPIFSEINPEIYSDYFHDICHGILPINTYIVLQRLCSLNILEITIFMLSGLLYDCHIRRGENIVQDIRNILKSNIISSKLNLTPETYRKCINFHSGYGNLEVGYCLVLLIQDLLQKYPNDLIILCRNSIKSCLDLYELCLKKDILSDIEKKRVIEKSNQIVESSIKLYNNQFGFSKKLHYILHYHKILNINGGTFCDLGTDRFEAAHQPCKKFYQSSKNHKVPAMTIIRKYLVKNELFKALKKYSIDVA